MPTQVQTQDHPFYSPSERSYPYVMQCRNKLEWGCPNGTKYPPQPIPNRAILPNGARLQTDGRTDRVIPVYPPNFVAGGITRGPKGLITWIWVPLVIFVEGSTSKLKLGRGHCVLCTCFCSSFIKFHSGIAAAKKSQNQKCLSKSEGGEGHSLQNNQKTQTLYMMLSTCFLLNF